MSGFGTIYNIQRYSLHDGPGIRTVVFFKGCPLRCRWCCNPESHHPQPEISYYKSMCIGKDACGYCQKLCTQGAIGFDTQNRAAIDRSKCNDCRDCAKNCPPKAIRVEGRTVTANEILDEVEKESVFYRDNTGGLTISGGEPLAQSDFLLSVLLEAKKRRINVAMETCGFGNYDVLKQAALLLDTVFYDIKSLNAEKHKEWTGQSNKLIIENLIKLCVDFPALPKIVRTPVVSGFNDSDEEIGLIRSFLQNKAGVTFETLPYHRDGAGKYEALGREYSMKR
jgi:pyruvate formate lyase activating enzyme